MFHESITVSILAFFILLICFPKLYCTLLYCTVLYCTVLYCTVLHCTALHCTALHCTALHCTALHSTVLYCTALHCTALHCTVLYCTVLYYCHWVSTQLQLMNISIYYSSSYQTCLSVSSDDTHTHTYIDTYFSSECFLQNHHFVQDTAQCPDISSLVICLTFTEFRCQVARSSKHGRKLCLPAACDKNYYYITVLYGNEI